LNGSPLHIAEPVLLRIKILEPILLLGRDRFANVDIRIRVSGGGFSSQVYAIRQAIAKAMVAYAQKCEYHFATFFFVEEIGLIYFFPNIYFLILIFTAPLAL